MWPCPLGWEGRPLTLWSAAQPFCGLRGLGTGKEVLQSLAPMPEQAEPCQVSLGRGSPRKVRVEGLVLENAVALRSLLLEVVKRLSGLPLFWCPGTLLMFPYIF